MMSLNRYHMCGKLNKDNKHKFEALATGDLFKKKICLIWTFLKKQKKSKRKLFRVN